jgi:hypothetical protein
MKMPLGKNNSFCLAAGSEESKIFAIGTYRFMACSDNIMCGIMCGQGINVHASKIYGDKLYANGLNS